MIAELIGGTLLLGSAVSGWIAAYRARGQTNSASDRARIAEAKAAASEAKAEFATSNLVASRVELNAAETQLVAARVTINRITKEHADEYERLAKAGIPVGDVLVGAALGVLYPHEDSDGGETGGGDAGGGGREVPHDPADPSGGTDPRR